MKKICALIACLQTSISVGTILVQGNAQTVLGTSNPNATSLSFPQAVGAYAFDHFTGQLYVGLSLNQQAPTPVTIGAAGTFAISFCGRASSPALPSLSVTTANVQTAFNGIASTSSLQQGCDFLALSSFIGNQYPIIGYVPSFAANSLTQTTMFILSNGQLTSSSQIIQQSAPILSVNPTTGAPGIVTTGIVGLEANAQYYFVPTFTDASGFGSNDSGIAVIGYDKTTLIPQQIAAVPNDPAVKSVLTDGTIPQVTIQGTPSIVPNRVALHWNNTLQRLYMGLQLSTASSGSGSAGDGVFSIVAGQQPSNQSGKLNLLTFMPGSALEDGQAINIAGVKQGASGLPLTISAGGIKSMKTSTGASYLIVWGGNGSITTDPTVGGGTTGANIYALPLVDVGDPNNVTQGVLANKNNFNPATHRFETPAAVNADLTTIVDPFSLVGTGTLPVQQATPISGIGGGNVNSSGSSLPINTLNMEVLGDTVYVALGNSPSDLDDSGVFYSQAMFDDTGKINAWTPWAKRAFPFNGFTNNPEYPDKIRFAIPDPVNNQLYAVDNFLGQTVRQTSWDNGQFLSPLPLAVSKALSNGCYSVLDLNQDTAGFNPATTYRYALFGGINTVVFAQISQARATPSSLQSSQTVTSSYQLGTGFNPQTFLVTQLPLNAGPVKTLEYSRQTTGQGSTNYFFAGGNNGLNVFADQFGNGFNVNTLNTLNLTPFSTGKWQHIPTIPGSVIDVKTLGSTLYVVTFEQPGGTPIYKVLSIPFTANIASMFLTSNINLIAQSGVAATNSDLSSTAIFYGIQSVVADSAGDIEQLALATNNGLFVSTSGAGVQAATTQSDAQWTQQNPASNATLFSSIAGIDTQLPTTVWPLSIQDPTRKGIYNRSSVWQLSAGDDTDFGYSPTPFEPNSNNPTQATFPFISYFWSDGGQSMMIANSQPLQQSPQSLLAVPHSLTPWNISSGVLITAPVVVNTPNFYWLKRIGVTGLLLAGTNQGVIALE